MKMMDVRSWYLAEYPTDGLGASIRPGLTWEALMEAVPLGSGFYDVLGVDDSVIRERCFSMLADLFCGGEYGVVFEMWLGRTA